MSRFATVIPPAGLLDVTRPIALAPLLFGRRLHMGTLYVVTIAPPLLVLLGRTHHMGTTYVVTIAPPLLVLLGRTRHMGTMYVVTIAPPLLVLLGRTPLVGTTYVVTIARLRLGLLVRWPRVTVMQVIRDEVMKTMGMGAGPMGTGTRCCIHLALLLVCLVAVVSMQENI
jgi:hypothetical protein